MFQIITFAMYVPQAAYADIVEPTPTDWISEGEMLCETDPRKTGAFPRMTCPSVEYFGEVKLTLSYVSQ